MAGNYEIVDFGSSMFIHTLDRGQVTVIVLGIEHVWRLINGQPLIHHPFMRLGCHVALPELTYHDGVRKPARLVARAVRHGQHGSNRQRHAQPETPELVQDLEPALLCVGAACGELNETETNQGNEKHIFVGLICVVSIQCRMTDYLFVWIDICLQ